MATKVRTKAGGTKTLEAATDGELLEELRTIGAEIDALRARAREVTAETDRRADERDAAYAARASDQQVYVTEQTAPSPPRGTRGQPIRAASIASEATVGAPGKNVKG